MQIFFKSRTAQRAFKLAESSTAKKVDNGSQAGARRWAVELTTSKPS